jgi:hypothetical protein
MSAAAPSLPSLQRLAQSARVRSLRSPDGRHLAQSSDPLLWLAAQEAEDAHLPARGRVCDSTGKCNAPGNGIDGARLYRWDSARQVVTIRVDHTKLPEIWLEIDLSIAQLEAFLGAAQGAEDDDNDAMEEEAGEEKKDL